jgi:hypothetical protein
MAGQYPGAHPGHPRSRGFPPADGSLVIGVLAAVFPARRTARLDVLREIVAD